MRPKLSVGSDWLNTMLGTTVLEGMGEEELLAFAGTCADTERDAQLALLRVAYRWAITHPPGRLDPVESGKPGREKARRYGGDGTPEVCEFAAAELGARVGVSTGAAANLMADTLDLHHRGGDLWSGSRTARSRRPTPGTWSPRPAAFPRSRDRGRQQGGDVCGRTHPLVAVREQVKAGSQRRTPRPRESVRKGPRGPRSRRSYATCVRDGVLPDARALPVIDQIARGHSAYSEAIRDQFPELSDDERDVQAILMLATPGSDQDRGGRRGGADGQLLPARLHRTA